MSQSRVDAAELSAKTKGDAIKFMATLQTQATRFAAEAMRDAQMQVAQDREKAADGRQQAQVKFETEKLDRTHEHEMQVAQLRNETESKKVAADLQSSMATEVRQLAVKLRKADPELTMVQALKQAREELGGMVG